MTQEEKWFKVFRQDENLIVIRERLADIDPRFLTEYTNIPLLLGTHTAMLIDTGCGIFPLKPMIDDLIEGRKLIVINTHSHWDHVGGNSEFGEVFIHEIEKESIKNPVNLSMLVDSSKKIVKRYESINFSIQPATQINTLQEGDEFDLGGLVVKVFHTPGHSPGSTSLLSSNGALYTGDLAHYGSVFLPKKKKLQTVLTSIEKLIELVKEFNNIKIYPSHEKYATNKDLLINLHAGISNIENLWDKKQRNNFLRSWIMNDDDFNYIVSKI